MIYTIISGVWRGRIVADCTGLESLSPYGLRGFESHLLRRNMGIFDLIFPDTNKKIYRDDFRKALRRISELSNKERDYIERSFSNELKGGLSKFEIKQRCGELMHKTNDSLEPSEVEKTKNKLLKYFD